MDKRSFLTALEALLEQLPPAERAQQLSYYEELIDDMAEDGMTEAEAVEKLGGPERVAQSLLQELPLSELVRSRIRTRSDWKAVTVLLLVLGSPIWLSVLLALLAAAAAVFLAIWSVGLALFCAVLGLGFGGVGLLAATVILPIGFPQLLLPLGAGLLGLGLAAFVALGVKAAVRGLVRLTGFLWRLLKRLFMKRRCEA